MKTNVSVTGINTLDIPGLQTREYLINTNGIS
jgi:hypothetical protein